MVCWVYLKGTLLHLSHLFPNKVPPVLSFHTGTVGFLMAHNSWNEYENIIEQVIEEGFKYSLRGRIQGKIFKYEDGKFTERKSTALNEIVLQRYHPKLANLLGYSISLDDDKLTTSFGDGYRYYQFLNSELSYRLLQDPQHIRCLVVDQWSTLELTV